MIIHNVEQGSVPWYTLRLGIPTASCFEKIVTPGGKLSAQSKDYACLLVAEKLLNRSLVSLDGLEWIERGRELEPEAIKAYEFEIDQDTQPVGFITTDDLMIGASPDRLVGDKGLLELKCPAPQTQVSYMHFGFGDKYKPQVQGQLLVSGREWVERVAYHPEFPLYRQRDERDDAYIALLEKSLREFNEMRLDMLEKIGKLGFFAERKTIVMPLDAEVDYTRLTNAG